MTRSKVLKSDVIAYRLRNPCLNMSDIAEYFSISRERVRQILNTVGVKTTRATFGISVTCSICGKHKHSGPPGTVCWSCHKERSYIEVVCTNCGSLFKHSAKSLVFKTSRRLYQHFFCNRKCFGSWVGKQNKGRHFDTPQH